MKMEEARELLLKHLYLQGGDGLGISDGRVYNACLDAIMEALTLTDVSKSVNCGNCSEEESNMYCEKCYSQAYESIGY